MNTQMYTKGYKQIMLQNYHPAAFRETRYNSRSKHSVARAYYFEIYGNHCPLNFHKVLKYTHKRFFNISNRLVQNLK